MFREYAEAGSWTQQTLHDNCADLRKVRFRQRVAVNLEDRTTATKMIGQDVSMPVALAPIGMLGMQSADGEIKAARAAEKFGVPFTLSTMSICSIEDVAAHTTKGFWFQLYVMRDADFVDNIIERAKSAGCTAMVLTLDLQLLGQRNVDIKNGLSAPPSPTIGNLLNLATKPHWCWGMLRTRRRSFRNIVGHAKGVSDASSLVHWTNEHFDLRLNWKSIEQIKEKWGGPLILKGINDPEDARRAVDVGANAIIVSNHGGRQLDGAMSSIRMLPRIVEAVGDKMEIHMDSGIRSGQDVLRALALGATGTMIGRAYVYGLGALGEAGVTRALEVIHKELDKTMALCGERDIRNVGRKNILLPSGFEDEYS